MRHESIDEYIRSFSPETQKILEQLRAAIREAAPDAEEKMSYQMPTFYLNGNLIHFAGYENNVGVYGASTTFQKLEKELAPYIAGKGTLRFPIDKPIPLDLIKKVVKLRAQENTKK